MLEQYLANHAGRVVSMTGRFVAPGPLHRIPLAAHMRLICTVRTAMMAVNCTVLLVVSDRVNPEHVAAVLDPERR